jgi:signal transduction histidine kinase
MALARRQAELALGIVEAAVDAIVVVGDEERILVFNAAAERIFRCEASAAMGQPVGRFLVLERPFDESSSGRLFVRVLCADGLLTCDATVSRFHLPGVGQLRAIILRDATALSRQVTDRLDAQAKRISQALHDQAAQFVAAAHVAVADAARDLPEATRRRLEEVRAHLNCIEEEFRRIAHELRPRILDDLGLMPAVQFLADSAERRCGLRVTVDGEVERPLPHDVEITVYRMTQEAVSNATRHAHAKQLHVTFEQTPRTLVCAIEDDGVGFNSGAVSARGGETGFGLPGLTDQVLALGGSLMVDSVPGRGTKVTAMIPLNYPPCL